MTVKSLANNIPLADASASNPRRDREGALAPNRQLIQPVKTLGGTLI
jgi:hypothetical protein